MSEENAETSSDDDTNDAPVILYNTMEDNKKKRAIRYANHILKKMNKFLDLRTRTLEKDVPQYISQRFNEKFDRHWHCIVRKGDGRGFEVNQALLMPGCYINFCIKRPEHSEVDERRINFQVFKELHGQEKLSWCFCPGCKGSTPARMLADLEAVRVENKMSEIMATVAEESARLAILNVNELDEPLTFPMLTEISAYITATFNSTHGEGWNCFVSVDRVGQTIHKAKGKYTHFYIGDDFRRMYVVLFKIDGNHSTEELPVREVKTEVQVKEEEEAGPSTSKRSRGE